MLLSVSHDTVVSNKHEEWIRHYYVIFQQLEVPTVTDNLYTQTMISQEVLGIFFSPASKSKKNGELMFGDYDRLVTTSSVNYVPLVTTFPASEFWSINQSISYSETTIMLSAAGIVDTGITLIPITTSELCV